MLHSDKLIEHCMDNAFQNDLFVAIDACLFRGTGRCDKDRQETGKNSDHDLHALEHLSF